MSRRSVQRKVWHSIFRGIEESRLSWVDKTAWFFVIVFVVYMIVVK